MIKISERIKKEADRVGGVALHIPWPSELGEAPDIKLGEEYDSRATEHAWARAQLPRPMIAKSGIEVVHVATRIRGGCPQAMLSERQRVYLVIVLIGARWVHARGAPPPKNMIAVSIKRPTQ